MTDRKESEKLQYKHVGLRDLGRYLFSRFRDRSIYLRRLDEQTLALSPMFEIGKIYVVLKGKILSLKSLILAKLS